MPRINQKAQEYADEDFRRELYICMANIGLRYDKDLSELSGIPNSTMAKKIHSPSGLTVAQLRKIISAVWPDPVAVLKFLGYSEKDIKKIGEKVK